MTKSKRVFDYFCCKQNNHQRINIGNQRLATSLITDVFLWNFHFVKHCKIKLNYIYTFFMELSLRETL